MHVSLSRSEASCQLNVLFNSDGQHGMLEDMHYQYFNSLSHFISGYVNRVTEYENQPRSEKFNMLSSDLIGDLWFGRSLRGVCDEQIACFKES